MKTGLKCFFFLIRCLKKKKAKMQNKIVKMLLITKIQAIIIVVSIYILQQNLNRVGCIGTFPYDLHILCIQPQLNFLQNQFQNCRKQCNEYVGNVTGTEL